MESNSDDSLFAVWGSSGNDIYTAGFSGNILHYNGSDWGKIYNAETTIYGMWGSSATDALFVGLHGLIMQYNGTHWIQMHIGVTMTKLFGVWGTDPYNIYAVGAGAGLFHSDGSTWSQVNMSHLTTADLFNIWGSSASDVFVCGDNGTVLHYNGSLWRVMDTGFSGQPLIGIWGTSSSNVFAVGYHGTILHYDGSNWTRMTSGTVEDLIGVWGSSAGNVLTSGGLGTVLRYDGTAWAPMHTGTTVYLGPMWGSSAQNIYVTGKFDLFRYNGSTWSKVYTSTDDLYGLWGSSAGNVYATGDWGNIFHYNGTRWSKIACTSAICGDTLFNTWGSSATDIYAVGDEGAILHYSISTPEAPAVSTGIATGTTSVGATLNGTLTSMGTCAPVNVSFQYGPASGTYTVETADQQLSATGPFFTVIDTWSNSPGQSIYFRARADSCFGTAYGAEGSFQLSAPPPVNPPSFVATQTHHGSANSSPSQQSTPVALSNIIIQSATLAATRVAPDEKVTVSATVSNRGSANGTARITLYVNGQETESRGVSLSSGQTVPIDFTVSRSDPGPYTVYVGSVPAGSFTVDDTVDTNMLLYISGALVLIALVGGLVFFLGRRRQGN